MNDHQRDRCRSIPDLLKLHTNRSKSTPARYVKQIVFIVRHWSPKIEGAYGLNEGDHTLVFTVDTQLFPHYFSGSTFQRRLAPLF